MLSSVEKLKLFHPPLDWMPRSKSQAHDELSSIRKTLLITRDSNSNSIPPSLFFFNQLGKFSMCLHNDDDEEGKESKSSENLALPEDSLLFSFSVVYCRNCLFVLMSSTTFFFQLTRIYIDFAIVSVFVSSTALRHNSYLLSAFGFVLHSFLSPVMPRSQFLCHHRSNTSI